MEADEEHVAKLLPGYGGGNDGEIPKIQSDQIEVSDANTEKLVPLCYS